MTSDVILFFTLALIAVASAVSMLLSRSAVYAALFLVINFLTIAAIYLLLHAAFIAVVQVSVYAGAIMVLFLFVIMLLGAERVEATRREIWQQPVALILAGVLIVEMAYVLFTRPAAQQPLAPITSEDFGSPASVGRLLFSSYLLPFEVTSILLLVSMVGAIVLTRDDRKEKP